MGKSENVEEICFCSLGKRLKNVNFKEDVKISEPFPI